LPTVLYATTCDRPIDKTTVNELTRTEECRPAANGADQSGIEIVSASPPTQKHYQHNQCNGTTSWPQKNARRQLRPIS